MAKVSVLVEFQFSFFENYENSLELSCCKKRQKKSEPKTGLGIRGRLKVLNGTKLILIEHE